MAKQGSFSFVLHTHFPYVRQAGSWPHGEEMVHEGICDTYVPLLDALYDLAEEGCPYRIAIEITPILAEQLADPVVIEDFRRYMAALIQRVEDAEAHYSGLNDSGLASLARFYIDWHERILDHFEHRFGANLIGAFRQLQDRGFVELVAGVGTHPFLPLMSRDSTIRAHLNIGLADYERLFGRKATCVWLPECGYRPAEYDLWRGQVVYRPGLETFLEEAGIRAFFADSAAIEGGGTEPVPGRVSSYLAKEAVASPPVLRRLPSKNTAWPYLVSDSGVAAFGRDRLTGGQVWSASEGYPGHFDYREFHKKDAICGMRFWKITGNGVALGDKQTYSPQTAFAHVPRHADHFVGILERHIAGNASLLSSPPPIVVAPYDTELFGHWWFEGVEWLKQVLRRLASHTAIELTTPGAYVKRYPPIEKIALPESSWGAGGDERTWMNDATRWMWPIIHDYERQMEQVVAQFPSASGTLAAALAQAARELALLESSDWPFLVSTGQAEAYASLRFRTHAARFDALIEQILSGQIDSAELGEVAQLDNPFPAIDYRAFAEAQPRTAPVRTTAGTR